MTAALAALIPVGAAAEDGPLARFWENVDIGAQVAFEPRIFFQEPAFDGQLEHFQPSGFVELDLEWRSDDRDTDISIVPFFRLDGQDEERTHFDLREGYLRQIFGDWEVLLGANRRFWGVTESRHLVNIVNQIDAVEDIDEEDFLGQPMLNVARQTDIGRFEAFLMTGFRERTFAGRDGRLRADPVVDTEAARFDSDLAEWRPEFALRYSHFIGDIDLGLHMFHGTSREPDLLVDGDGSRLVPSYPVITQGGIDLQYTTGPYLWKFEGLVRGGQGDTFAAAVGGLEYTWFQALETDADLGLLAEGLWDGREESRALSADEAADGFVSAAPFQTVLDQEVFLGTRLTLNDVQDTAVLAGVFIDVEDGPGSLRLEAERRIGQNWFAEVEATVFLEGDRGNAASAFERDSFITLRLSRFF
ncbi:MAG: hypothetical protein AAFR52_11590 [Pseudomonadota bacterium]